MIVKTRGAGGKDMRKIVSLIILSTAFVVLNSFAAPTSVDAFSFNPLKAVGNVVGGVLHGIGGVLGQGLSGLAGPTIEDAGNKMQQVANGAISAADAAAGRRIDQLSEKLTNAITQADEVVTKHIQEIDPGTN